MEQVYPATLDEYLERYRRARGGFDNEDTDSEAAFVMIQEFRGAYILGQPGTKGPVWIGIQNATARWTNGGHPFPDVRDACSIPFERGLELWYSEDGVTRLRWLADRIEKHRASGRVQLLVE